MPHPGITFALAVGVALGAIIYYLIPNWEQPHNYDELPPPPRRPGQPSNSSDEDPNIRRRRKAVHDVSCSICLVKFTDEVTKERKLNLKCGHSFHENCIITWLRQKSECPNCRMSI